MSNLPHVRIETSKYANDFVRRVEKTCQETIYTDFKLATVKLDWDKKRRSSRGGMYADGPGINMAMWHMVQRSGDVYKVTEYRSFDSDPEIGGFYSQNRWHKLEMVLLHEIAHALQYYCYKLNKFRCKPHGPTWKNFYRRLRLEFLNPYLGDQKELKAIYDKQYEEVLKQDEFAWMNRAASAKDS